MSHGGQNGQKSIWKKNDHCGLKMIMHNVYGKIPLAGKMAKLAFLMLLSGRKWSKVNLKKSLKKCVLKNIKYGVSIKNFTSPAFKMAKLALLTMHGGQNCQKSI